MKCKDEIASVILEDLWLKYGKDYKGKGKEAEHDHLKVNKDDKGKGNVHDIQNRLGELEVDSARAIKARQVDDHDDDLDTLDLENRIKKLEEDFVRLLKAKKAKEAKKSKKAKKVKLGKEAKKDLSTDQIVVVGKGSRCLYICKPTVDPTAFSKSVSEFHKSHLTSVPFVSLDKQSYSTSVSKNVLDVHTLHARLGHSSGDCILAATYLIYKMLAKVLDWKTPFEKLYGKPPTYDHLRVIGCLFNVAVTEPHKDKFNDKGIPHDHIDFLANVFAIIEPNSYKQASKEEGWIKAINDELAALKKNETQTLTTLPPGHKPITSKWVYKIKYLPTGIMDKLKAKLVVRGFNQKEGIDYKHTFSPVAKLATMRVLVALATAKELPLHQPDVNNAFLYGYIDDELGIVPSNDYPIKMNCDNFATIIMAKESRIQKGAIHFKIKYHYVRECIETGEIDIVKVYIDNNLADSFTKALAGHKLTQHTRSMGLRHDISFM
nr:retrovirus-related Pol polyprotein from transposon TNT 1-94 [Tanacetum cinerariifolium]